LNQYNQDNQPNQKQSNSLVGNKLSIKTNALIDNNLSNSLTYQTTKSKKKETISTSPKDKRKGSKEKKSH